MPADRGEAPREVGGVFANRSYRRLFAAAAISNYGSMLHAMALPFVAVATLDATPADVASLTAAGLLPSFLLGLLASAWVDRLRRRRVLVAADWARALLVLWIPAAAWQGWLDLAQLHAVVALHGLLTFLFGAAHHAVIPAVVRADQLVEANGRLKAAEAVTEGLAFASGGWLIQLWSAPFAFVADGLSYAASALCLVGVEAREPEPTPGAEPGARALLAEVAEGLRFLVGHPLLLPATLGLALLAMSWRMATVVYVLFVYEELGFAPGVLGFVFAAGGVASLLGAVAAERVSPRIGVGTSMIVGVAGFALATLLLPLAPGVGAVGLALLVAHQLGDGCEVLFDVHLASLRQSVTPARLLGRVAGAGAFAATAAMLAGLALGGLLGETFGLRATLAAAGVVALLGAARLAASPIRTLRRLPAAR